MAMAHLCPVCGLTCRCGGDLDDIVFGDAIKACGHCLVDDLNDPFDEDDPIWDDEEYDEMSSEEREDNRKAFEAEMANWPQVPFDGTRNPEDDLPF